MDRLCPRNARQSTGHVCKKDTWAVGPTWNVRLSPVSEDKGQDSTTRGGQGDGISSGFEPAKALVRGLPLPRPPSFQGQLGSYQSYDLSGESAQTEPRLWPSRGIQGVNSDRLVAEGETSTTRGCAPTGVPASVTRGALSRPGLDLLDLCRARGDAIQKNSPKRHVIPQDRPAISQLLHRV